MWHTKKLTELSATEFYEILKLRIDTFVVEQQRIYHEVDALDENCFHIFYQNDKGKVLAYGRVFKQAQVNFGRVVIAQAARGKGLANQLIVEILDCCEKNWPAEPIIIEAQEQVKGLYQKFGFNPVGDVFIHEGSPHIEMVKESKTDNTHFSASLR